MRARRDRAVIAVGAVACAACCAGPVAGFVAAIGIGAATGLALVGVAGLVAAVLVGGLLLRRRRRAAADRCRTSPAAVAVAAPAVGRRR